MKLLTTFSIFCLTTILLSSLLFGIIILWKHNSNISQEIQTIGEAEEPKKYNIIEAYKGNNLDFSPFDVNGTEAQQLTTMLNEEIGEGELDTTVTGTITSVAQYTQILISRLEEALKDDPDELEEYIVSDVVVDETLLGANDDDKNKVKTKEKKIKVKDLLNIITDAQVVKSDGGDNVATQ